ncbi:MAG: hypothetical protein CMP23_01265 [Rickettsiales bacterium]|nr:hypothetical protein [Rickettsiales bacterium]
MAGYVVGIDLGPRCVRATVLKTSLRGYEIEDFLSVEPVQPGPGELQDPQAVAAAAHAIIDTLGYSQMTIVASMSAQSVSSWLIEMPFSDPKRIAQTLAFEIENYVPWDLDDVILDYRIVDGSRDGAQVLAVMAAPDRLEHQLDSLSAAGVEPRHLTVDAAALALLAPDSDEGIAILNIDPDSTLVSVVCKGTCRWIRGLERGADFLSGTAPMGSSAWTPGDIEPLDRWINELRTSLIAAEEAGAPEVEHLYLCGDREHLELLSRRLAEELGVPCEVLQLPAPPKGAEKAPRPDPEHALCYALALAGLSQNRSSVPELRKEAFAYAADSKLQARLTLLAVATVVLLALSAIGMHIAQTAGLKAELASINEDLISAVQQAFPSVPSSALLSSESVMSVMNEQVANVDERIENLTGPKLTPLLALKELSEIMPTEVKVDVSEYLLNNEMIRIQAKTDSFGSVDSIEAAILGNQHFKQAQKSNVNKARNGKMSFTVTIPRNDSSQEDEG